MIKNIQQQKLAQRFSPSQIQLMNMLAMPALVFEQYLANEIESNPALDADYTPETSSEDTPSDEVAGENTTGADEASGEDRDDFDLADYMYEDEAPDYVPTSSQRDDPPQSDRNTFIAAQSAQNTFVEHLLDQLRMEPLSEDQMTIGRYIIGNLDADGYLRRTPEAIADDLAFSVGVNASPQQVEQVLEVIRGFDPPGVGAHSLQDCLSLQLRQMEDTPSVRLARRIVSDFFPALGKKNYAQIQERTGCSREELAGAVEEIARLNPKPGGAYSGTEEESSLDVTPDFIIRVEDDQVEVSLCEADSLPALRVSRQYTDLLDGLSRIAKPTRSQQETAAFVRSKIDAARWFIDAVAGRRATLLRIMQAIARRQKKYLLSGDVADMVPLGLKDIASDVSMDISTVSRVASQKYADTPYGVMRLKDFFSEGSVNRDGEDISTREIKQSLEALVQSEDKRSPYTDEQLTALLSEKGYNVARRTVAKYREALGLPTARLRRQV